MLPFRLDTREAFETMRVASTPHTWSNAQDAWDAGRMGNWPAAKKNHSMAYYTEGDMPFQYAMARAFTVCDAYHCSFTGGTNTNRLFLWTGTNDGLGRGKGPALGNLYNKLKGGDPAGGYTWTTYPERLEAAGVSWCIYQDMADNYSLNPTAGFKAYRDAYHGLPGSRAALKDKALSTRSLDALRQDVLDGKLPQVSWICATKAGSEHPSPSSPAQGAAYTARVLDALTADPEVWSRTALLLMFDENDGFFDHMPPPAPPSRDTSGALAGASTVDTAGEYHEIVPGAEKDDTPAHLHGVYGLGPRVPMYVLSPWTKGGWVNSQVFDHTSVLRFIEQRFGVAEPNISAWRRAVCGDLTSIFDFAAPEGAGLPSGLPATAERAGLASALPGTVTPLAPLQPERARQQSGTRPSRPRRLMRCRSMPPWKGNRYRCGSRIPARPARCSMCTTGCAWSAGRAATRWRPASSWRMRGRPRPTMAATTSGYWAPTDSTGIARDARARRACRRQSRPITRGPACRCA